MNFFSDNTRVRIFIFLSRKARIFFPEFNIMLYDKNSESDFFFSLHQNQNIFFSIIGNQNIFLEKNHNPPPPPPPPFQVKWSFPYDVFFYVFLGKSMDRTFLSVGSPFIEEGGKMPQSHSIAVLSFFFLCFFIYFVFF